MTFRHPSLLARMSAAVDRLAPGRLVCGVGAGWNTREHEAFGIPFPSMRERMDRLEEGIRVLKALWSGEKVSVEGKYYPLEDAQMRPAPTSQPPLLIGGGGERRTLRLVAQYADEWNSTSLSPDGYRDKSAVLAQHCSAVGRDPASIYRSMMVTFVIGRDEAERNTRLEALREVMPRMASAPLDQLRGRGMLIGTPDDFVAGLRALAAAGVERVMLQHLNQTDDGALELIAREVLPAVADA
jgi:alkanesulfonate monooxygenase SsuD/methylene tetrahydromethanopterin reductase-like flavin-dependent oxidoreductase (luciferase family)